MSKYTTQLRYICEQKARETGVTPETATINEICEAASPLIFDIVTDINTKILVHFYMREIGAETFGLWRLWLNETLTNLWEYKYQRVFEAWANVDPLTGYSETRTINRKTDGTKSGNNSAESSSLTENSNTATESNTQQESDTPQNGLQSVRDGSYLSSAQVVDRSGTELGKSTTDGETVSTFSETGKTAEDVAENISGHRENASEMINDFLRLPSVIESLFNDLEPLFIQLF